ncbi:MAG: sulfur oxidation c-type cytochrome SoxX [Lautropia sp.]
MNKQRITAVGAFIVVAAGCAAIGGNATAVSDQEVEQALKASFKAKSIAKVERLDQTELQRTCSKYAQAEMPSDVKAALQKAAMDSVKYPADGQYLGDHKAGEKIAQNGRGLQFSDNEKTVNGGNCYACHQLTKSELSYGNIGPSLYNYGKLRGNSEAIQKYTWARIWNSHAFNACVTMPRFGAAGILSEAQIKDVMALLLDPASPVNQ